MLTKTMALELAHLGIRVNAVCPGYLQTPMSMEIDSPEFVRNFVDRYIPLNRSGKVEDVAPMFLFLAGDESSFITGQVFIADGGQLAGQKPGDDLLGKINFDFLQENISLKVKHSSLASCKMFYKRLFCQFQVFSFECFYDLPVFLVGLVIVIHIYLGLGQLKMK